jgi:hypothetical protein
MSSPIFERASGDCDVSSEGDESEERGEGQTLFSVYRFSLIEDLNDKKRGRLNREPIESNCR